MENLAITTAPLPTILDRFEEASSGHAPITVRQQYGTKTWTLDPERVTAMLASGRVALERIDADRNLVVRYVPTPLVEYIKNYASERYSKGWDFLVECWTDEEIEVELSRMGATTQKQAIGCFKPYAEIHAERLEDAKNSI